MRLSAPKPSIGWTHVLSPVDDSYHAFLDPCWLQMFSTHVTSSTVLTLVRKRFYVMRSV